MDRSIVPTLDQFAVEFRVIGALIMRELQSRFGRNNIGYLWVVGEPLLLATVIGVLHAFQPGHIGSSMPPIPFSILGYVIFIILRGIFNKAEAIVETNAGLLYHQQISILNLSIARAMVEAVGCFGTLVILLGATIALGYADLPARPIYILAAVGWMVWLSFAMGLNVTWITFERPTLGRLVHPISYFMLPISGAFIAIDWLPGYLQEPMEWFPFTTIFEYARYGMFLAGPDGHLFGGYVTACCAGLTYSGLLGIRRLRHRIHLS